MDRINSDLLECRAEETPTVETSSTEATVPEETPAAPKKGKKK